MSNNNPYKPVADTRPERPIEPCKSNPPLFESERLEDHVQAKKVCDTCPLIAACQRNLEDTIKAHGYGAGVGPRGTWAGKLYAPDYKGRDNRPNRRPIPAGCGTASGTPNGYARHRRRDEDSCQPCLDARNEQRRNKYNAAKGDAA